MKAQSANKIAKSHVSSSPCSKEIPEKTQLFYTLGGCRQQVSLHGNNCLVTTCAACWLVEKPQGCKGGVEHSGVKSKPGESR